jgi:hypothetical protein
MSLPFTEPSQFKSLEDSVPERRATSPPRCIRELDKHVDTKRKNLTDEQGDAAVKELVNKDFIRLEFPRTMKLQVDPPLNGQTFALYSFIPAKDARPDLQGCFGVLKIRGCFPNEPEADQWSENLIRGYDSYAKIDFTWVGRPFPLMVNNELYRGTTREIDIRRKVDEIQREELKTRREEEKREQEDIQRRHRELMRDVSEDRKETPDDLELYVQLRVKYAHARFTKDELLKRLTDYDANIDRVEKEIAELDKKEPAFKEQYIARYTSALEAAGIPVHSAPLIKYMS